MRKSKRLTVEELKKDHLGSYVYEETRGKKELRVLIKFNWEGRYFEADSGGFVDDVWANCETEKKRYWRGFPTQKLRKKWG